MKNSVHNICTCTQIWTILSVLTKTKPNCYNLFEISGVNWESVQNEGSTKYRLIAHTVLHTTHYQIVQVYGINVPRVRVRVLSR